MTMDQESREAVRTVIASIPHHIDAKRWGDLRGLFAAEVRTDYTSLFGGSPQTQTGDALVDGWKGMLAVVATQHLLGPITVKGVVTGARAACHVRAMHHAAEALGGPFWEVLGHYELRTFLQTGNTKLLEEATA